MTTHVSYPRWVLWLMAHWRTHKARPSYVNHIGSYVNHIGSIGTGRVYTSDELRHLLRIEDDS